MTNISKNSTTMTDDVTMNGANTSDDLDTINQNPMPTVPGYQAADDTDDGLWLKVNDSGQDVDEDDQDDMVSGDRILYDTQGGSVNDQDFSTDTLDLEEDPTEVED